MTSWQVVGINLLSNKAQNIARISQVFSSWYFTDFPDFPAQVDILLAASFESRMKL